MEFSEKKEKDYLIQLVQNLAVVHTKNRTIPFKIEELKEKGLLVKVGGLFSYVPFSKMPWKYAFQDAWKAVFPFLKNYVFYCKIVQIEKDPLRILIDPSATLFKEPIFIPKQRYESIVIYKAKYGVFVELGACLDWKSGSQISLLHDSILKKRHLNKEDLAIGQLIKTTYHGIDSSGNLILDDEERAAFNAESIKDLIGQIITVKVQKESAESKPTFLVKDKFKGILSITKTIYNAEEKQRVRKEIKLLEDGQSILCEVLDINHRKGIVKLKWQLT